MKTNVLKKVVLMLLCVVSASVTVLGKDLVSNVLPIADPYILFYNGTYYAYGTSRADGFEVYSSNDLKSWERSLRLALNKEDSYGDKWFWAPEVYYVEKDKKFYMYYSVEEHVCVAMSDSPLGPFVQDIKKPIREEKGIDTSVFFDEDGKAYLYFVRFTNGNVIWCAELEENLKEIKEETLTQCIEAAEPWEMVFGKVAEGPSIVKRDGLYYLLYSANDFRSQDYAVGYATSDSPFGADTLPRVGSRTPANIFNRVDLPAPFFPIRAILSFSLITKDISENNALPPNSTVSPSTEIIYYINVLLL